MIGTSIAAQMLRSLDSEAKASGGLIGRRLPSKSANRFPPTSTSPDLAHARANAATEARSA